MPVGVISGIPQGSILYSSCFDYCSGMLH